MENLFTKIFEVFSLEYVFSVIVASYLVLKLIDAINGDKVVPTWLKRTITCVVGTILFGVFLEFAGATVQSLVASFFAAVFVYDVAIKALLKKFNIDYKE